MPDIFAQSAAQWFTAMPLIAWKIFLVLIGINALIIVHEFGHFIVARMCGVRCDKFYIWFDFFGLRFFRFKWGQTEYGLGLFPLGGYVKMFGQEDNPGQLAQEIQRAKLAAENQNTATTQATGSSVGSVEKVNSVENAGSEKSVEQLERVMYAPDSFLSKSVPQRMAIIVAGVVMNILFAFVCAAAAYMVGISGLSASIGSVTPGSPAWAAGIQSGDRIVSIDGQKMRHFMEIQQTIGSSAAGTVSLEIERIADDGQVTRITKELEPQKRSTDIVPSMGASPLMTLRLSKAKSPVDERFTQNQTYSDTLTEKIPSGGMITAIEGVPVHSYKEYLRQIFRHVGEPLAAEITSSQESPHESTSPNTVDGQLSETSNGAVTTLVLPPLPLNEIPVRFQIGAVTAVQQGTDAKEKGISLGDVIVAVDNDTEFDPLKLPYQLRRRVNRGDKTVQLSVQKNNGETQTVEVALIPDAQSTFYSLMSWKDTVACETLGIAFTVSPIIAGVTTMNEPTTEPVAAIPKGAVVEAVTFLNPFSADMEFKTTFCQRTEDGFRFNKIGDSVDIPFLFSEYMQYLKSGGKVRLHFTHENTMQTVDMTIQPATDWFEPRRGFLLTPDETLVKATGLGEAAVLGFQKTVNSTMEIFRVLRNLIGSDRTSPRALGGPVMIVKAAYMMTSEGFGTYLLFLCLIGANLAVLNILPFPVLDGGLLVFLVYEGVTGRQPNETFQVILSYLALFALLSLMIWVLALDLGFIYRV